MDIIFDIETYPNCFLLNMMSTEGERLASITFYQGSSMNAEHNYRLRQFMSDARARGYRMVGFNNLGFDYPVLHYILMSGCTDPAEIYAFAMAVLGSENKFQYMVRESDRAVPQIDLFKIHHFDNKARMTSLKALEFNMRMANVSDLPFPVGSSLTPEQVVVLRDYCWHDVEATRQFYLASKEKITFREQLCIKHPGRDWMNFNDVKIGKEFFTLRLEAAGVQCYEFGPDGRQPRQTQRGPIALRDCIPDCVSFTRPPFQIVKELFEGTVIINTKADFKQTVIFNCIEYVFGTGGIHASVEHQAFRSDDEMMIYDVDVTSLYPSIAIEHGIYPEHLGPKFVDVYRQLRTERLSHKKGSAENGMLKLALNGVYGASNDPFSVFFDPLFTMKITVGGQLMIAMLIEWLVTVTGVKVIQANTDGVTLYMPRTAKWLVDALCLEWEKRTRLSLEYAEFDRMHIADVNSYIARKVDGTVKRKGRYEYDVEWHQDASALVVQKVAEKVILEDVPIRETVESWPDLFDFMLRIKVNRGSRLVLVDGDVDRELTDRTVRYYISKEGLPMVKVMPPLAKKPGEYRRIAVNSGWRVQVCNDITHALQPIDFDWYVNEVEKLVLGVL